MYINLIVKAGERSKILRAGIGKIIRNEIPCEEWRNVLVPAKSCVSQSFIFPDRQLVFRENIPFAELAKMQRSGFSRVFEKMFANIQFFCEEIVRIEEEYGTAAALFFGSMIINGAHGRDAVLNYAELLDTYVKNFDEYYPAPNSNSLEEFIKNLQKECEFRFVKPGVARYGLGLKKFHYYFESSTLASLLKKSVSQIEASGIPPESLKSIGNCIALTTIDNIIFLRKGVYVRALANPRNLHVFSAVGEKEILGFENVGGSCYRWCQGDNQIFNVFSLFSSVVIYHAYVLFEKMRDSSEALNLASFAYQLNPFNQYIGKLLNDIIKDAVEKDKLLNV